MNAELIATDFTESTLSFKTNQRQKAKGKFLMPGLIILFVPQEQLTGKPGCLILHFVP